MNIALVTLVDYMSSCSIFLCSLGRLTSPAPYLSLHSTALHIKTRALNFVIIIKCPRTRRHLEKFLNKMSPNLFPPYSPSCQPAVIRPVCSVLPPVPAPAPYLSLPAQDCQPCWLPSAGRTPAPTLSSSYRHALPAHRWERDFSPVRIRLSAGPGWEGCSLFWCQGEGEGNTGAGARGARRSENTAELGIYCTEQSTLLYCGL